MSISSPDLIAYRVYLRSPGSFWSGRRQKSIVVVGEAALDRQLARNSPIAIWFEPALRHRCQACGKEGYWSPSWVAWDRYRERHTARGEGVDIYCSIDCAKAQNPDLQWPSWMNVNEEPAPKDQRRALWVAQRRDQDAQAEARKAVRGVPMPDWPGPGFCKWCTKPVKPPRSSWHEDCYKDYCRHTSSSSQAWFLEKRDGPGCKWPGCDARGREVDHRVPLWKVAHLPPDQRRPYFGPANIWLLCQRHHKAKTKLEAAERAQARRQARPAAQGQTDLFSGYPKKTLPTGPY